MSDAVALTVKTRLDAPLDLSGITPDRCANLSHAEIAALPVWVGGSRALLGDVTPGRRCRAACFAWTAMPASGWAARRPARRRG